MLAKTPNIALREANIDDLEILKLWDKQQHNIDSDPNDDWEWETELPRNPPWRQQLMATLDGRPLGFIQIIDPAEEESHYWGNIEPNLRAIDIWIGMQDDLGKGYGTIMMNLAIDACFANPAVKAIVIDPLETNHKARKFYEKLGFEFVEKRVFGLDTCCVYKLGIEKWGEVKNS